MIDRRNTSKGEPDATRYLYYVHYLEYNKRLDEWVPPDRLLKVATPASDGKADAGGVKSPALLSPRASLLDSGERKVTRNLKRRYDEIHHTAPAVEDLAPADQALEREHEETEAKG